MANAEKILKRMRSNPRDWRIEDLKVVADSRGLWHRQRKTSHVIFGHPKAVRTVAVPAARPIMPVYIRQFLALVDELEAQA